MRWRWMAMHTWAARLAPAEMAGRAATRIAVQIIYQCSLFESLANHDMDCRLAGPDQVIRQNALDYFAASGAGFLSGAQKSM